MLKHKALLRLISSFAMAVLVTGCAYKPYPVPESDPDASWALEVSHHTRLNGGGRYFTDAQSDPMELVGEPGKSSSGLGGAAMAGAFAMAPPSSGIPALNGLLFLDMLGGAPEPEFSFNYYTTLAWLPVSHASTIEEARDTLHEIRTAGVKKLLKEIGAEYRVKTNDFRQMIVAGPYIRQTTFIVTNDAGPMCDHCAILIATNVPDKKTVIAPNHLTGQPYEAYIFNGSLKPGSEGKTRSWTIMATKQYLDDPNHEGAFWFSRNYEHLTWLSQYNPEWVVEFIPAYTNQGLRNLKAGKIPSENPFPFMIHNGEVKHFVKGAK